MTDHDPLALGFRVESDVDEEGFRTNTRLVPARAPPPDSGGVREALVPFAKAADWFDASTIGFRDEVQEPYPDDHTVAAGFDVDGKCLHITVGDCRKARAALSRPSHCTERREETIPLRDLAMFWEGRYRALRLVRDAAGTPDTRTDAEIETYEECAKELRAALVLTEQNSGPAAVTKSAPDFFPSHNSGERLPSSDAAGSGADTPSPSTEQQMLEKQFAGRTSPKGSSVEDHTFAESSPSAEPVAWRWKPKTATLWRYDPNPEWLKDHISDVDAEPLYASPVSDASREARKLADSLQSKYAKREISINQVAKEACAALRSFDKTGGATLPEVDQAPLRAAKRESDRRLYGDNSGEPGK